MADNFLGNVSQFQRALYQKINSFIEGANGISRLRQVDWGKRYLWMVDFEDLENDDKIPAWFQGFFPASSLTLALAGVEHDSFRIGQTELSLPVRAGNTPSISLTFYDDEQKTLYRWFQEWIKVDILNNGRCISGLRDSHLQMQQNGEVLANAVPVRPVRVMRLAYLDSYKRITYLKSFSVVPTGTIDDELSQASEASEYTINFNIVGDSEIATGKINNDITIVQDVLGRIL